MRRFYVQKQMSFFLSVSLLGNRTKKENLSTFFADFGDSMYYFVPQVNYTTKLWRIILDIWQIYTAISSQQQQKMAQYLRRQSEV